MTRLLVLNPNTTAAVTERLRERAVAAAPATGVVQASTAGFGAPYISDEVAVAVAGHAVLEAYAGHVRQHGRPDAVMIGCFGDPGLLAMRALAEEPVHGLAEADMAQAASRGRYAIVTGGERWPPMLRRLASSLGLDGALAGIVAVQATGGELAADPEAAHRLLLGACQDAVARYRPAVLVLGGAALTTMHARLAAALSVPLLDSVDTALQVGWRSAADHAQRRRQAAPVQPAAARSTAEAAWPGASPALQALLDQPRPEPTPDRGTALADSRDSKGDSR